MKNIINFLCLVFFASIIHAAPRDSTNVAPMNPGQVTIQYPGQTTTTGPIVDEGYSTYAACPGDPKTSPNSKPICPDINGVYPQGGSAATCPDMCSVSRWTSEVKVGDVTRVLNTRDAVCPAGYIQAAQFNMQPQIKFVAKKDIAWAPTPMPFATVTLYKQAGYQCELYHAGTIEECHRADTSINKYHHPSNVDTQVPTNNYAGQFTGRGTRSTCYSQVGNCDQSLPNCGGLAKSTYDKKFFYDYSWYRCKPPEGLYYDKTVLVPTSLVCARIKTEWQQRNQPASNGVSGTGGGGGAGGGGVKGPVDTSQPGGGVKGPGSGAGDTDKDTSKIPPR